MQPRPAVARWRTKAVLAAVVLVAAAALIATVVGQTSGSDSSSHEPKAVRPQIASMGQNPLTVKGTGFRPGERVRIVVKGSQGGTLTGKAGPDGSFAATFRGVNGCDSVTVTAVGSKGSRASFNLSQIACIEP